MTLPRLALLALLLSLCGGAWGQVSYWTVRNSATTFDPLNGSTLGAVTGTEQYRAGGPFGQQMFDFDGSTRIDYGETDVPTTCSIAIWWQADGTGEMRIASLRDSLGILQRTSSNNIDAYANDGVFRNLAQKETDGNLHHAVAVADGTNLTLYVDGEEFSSVACGNLEATGNNNRRVGASHSGGAPCDGGAAEYGFWSGVALGAPEVAELKNGPEPTYTSGASLAQNGALDVGDWNSHNNGDAEFEWVVANAAGDVIDSGTGDTGTATGLTAGTLYLYVRASNDGGYDVGDHGEREGAYGEANDGYYEVASVTVPNYLNRTRYPWWLRRGAIETPRHYACRIELLGEELCIAV